MGNKMSSVISLQSDAHFYGNVAFYFDQIQTSYPRLKKIENERTSI